MGVCRFSRFIFYGAGCTACIRKKHFKESIIVFRFLHTANVCYRFGIAGIGMHMARFRHYIAVGGVLVFNHTADSSLVHGNGRQYQRIGSAEYYKAA